MCTCVLLFPTEIGTSTLCDGPELPDYSEDFQSSNLSGGVQLLIPAYQFSCIGGVVEWRAFVSLPENVSGNMEFHALRSMFGADDGVYELAYHNEYRMQNVNGSLLTLPVDGLGMDNSIIPVEVGDVVGIYMKNVSHPLELLFESASDGEGGNVYYWEGLSQRRCMYSICDLDVKVMQGVRPLISWTVDSEMFDHLVNNPLLIYILLYF